MALTRLRYANIGINNYRSNVLNESSCSASDVRFLSALSSRRTRATSGSTRGSIESNTVNLGHLKQATCGKLIMGETGTSEAQWCFVAVDDVSENTTSTSSSFGKLRNTKLDSITGRRTHRCRYSHRCPWS